MSVLDQGAHSGLASGIVPSSFRIIRTLLDRIEDSSTGRVLIPEFAADVPESRVAQARVVADTGILPADDFAWADLTRPVHDSPVEQLLDSTWEPTISYIGVDGMPGLQDAGSVLRASTTLMLSLRTPPTTDTAAAAAAMAHELTRNPPYRARVDAVVTEADDGWNASPTSPWLQAALDRSSVAHFGRESRSMGLGGSIPFITMLGESYPDAQYVITGALGPGSNAHGPNEFLDLRTAQRISACLAEILDSHATR